MAASCRASRLIKFASLAACVCLLLAFTAIPALGQNNPVPFVNQPLVPSAVAPGGPDFTLTVNGTGFVSGAINALREACAPHGAANPDALVCADVLQELPAPQRHGRSGDVVRRLFAAARNAAVGLGGRSRRSSTRELSRTLRAIRS